MQVFISWSGPLSKQVAEHLKTWVKCTLQETKPFVSFEDIEKGAFWFGEMGNKLAESDFSLVCLTKDNLTAPWILFEAGALSKGLTKNRVCTFLVNVTPSELVKPLSEFQATLPTQDDMLKLALSLNKGLSEPLERDFVQRSFAAFWPDFKQQFDKALQQHRTPGTRAKREQSELLIEVLEICRSMEQGVRQIAEVREFEKNKTIESANNFAKIQTVQTALAKNAVGVERFRREISRLEATLKDSHFSEEERQRTEALLVESKSHLDNLLSINAVLHFELDVLMRPRQYGH